MKPKISSHSIPTTTTTSAAGVIDAHVFEPAGRSSLIRGTIVTVHPWSALGGGEHNTIGLARHLVNRHINNSERDVDGRDINSFWRVVTFTLKSNSFWQGGAIWGICSNHAYEVQQTVDVVQWVHQQYGVDGSIVLLGSSAGAPMAGTAMAHLQQLGNITVSAYIAVGYTFGNFASIGFGRHFSSVMSSSSSSIPKLFIMGERDEFTSVDQLKDMANKMRAQNSNESNVVVEIVPKVGHFELESPRYDPLVAMIVLDWLDKQL
ncbi:hypothetical protein ACHAWU_004299 [Discostella pseudostelligera]|uniref:Serine hydrolase domain-containing protein n=1 Tax=Discostella pseudostelligera TaxID=259834 RepID=A0ABD3M6V0_9STRA